MMKENAKTTHRQNQDDLQQSRRHDDPVNKTSKNPFLVPLILISVFAVLEFYTGVWTQSLALLGDAWHMFSDVLALSLAMFAHGAQQLMHAHQSTNAADEQKTSKVELVVASINATLMLLVSAWIVKEALERLASPQPILGSYVMIVAFAGLVVNVIVARQLHHFGHAHGTHENLNHRAAFLHVIGDLLGSVAALIAGAVVFLTGWLPIDPILSIFIALLLLVSTAMLIKDIWQVIQHKKPASKIHHH